MIFSFNNDWSSFNKLGNSYDRRKQMADNALNDVKLLADSTDNVIKEYKTDKLWDEVNARKAQANKLKDMESKYANWQKEQAANEAAWNAQQDDNEARYNRRVSAYQTPGLPEGAEDLGDVIRYNGQDYSKEAIKNGNYDNLTADMLQPKKEIAPYQRQAYERPEYEGLQDLEAQRLVVGDQNDDWLWGKAMELKRLGDDSLLTELTAQRTRQQSLADRDEQRQYEAGVRKEQQAHEMALKNAEKQQEEAEKTKHTKLTQQYNSAVAELKFILKYAKTDADRAKAAKIANELANNEDFIKSGIYSGSDLEWILEADRTAGEKIKDKIQHEGNVKTQAGDLG